MGNQQGLEVLRAEMEATHCQGCGLGLDLEHQGCELKSNVRCAIQYLAGYTACRFDLYAMAGRGRAEHRAYLMAQLLGVPRVPQKEAGMHALTDAFYRALGVKEGCLAGREADFIAKAKAIFERG